MPYISKEHRDQMTTGLLFSLKDLAKKETYSVWDNNTREFIKDGQIIDKDGITHELKETKYMVADNFKVSFPGCNKNNKIERTIVINNEEFTYPMPKSVDTQIEQTIATLNAMGTNALTVQFRVNKEGTGLATRYTVVIGGKKDAPNPAPVTPPSPQTQSQPVIVEEVVVDTPSETTAVNREQLVLTTTEQQLVDVIIESATKAGRTFTFEEVKQNFLKYNIAEDRAMLVWMDNLQ
jgi:hypothetical protein